MAALSTEQVQELLEVVVPNREHVTVLGAFPADYLPIEMHGGVLYAFSPSESRRSRVLDMHKNYCFVLNTDKHDQPGMHWLAFFYDGNVHTRMLEFFDSYGMPIDFYPNVMNAINDRGLKHTYMEVNKHLPLQSLTSQVCGQYCLVFLAWRARHTSATMRMFMLDLCRGKTGDARDHIILNTLTNLLSRAVAHRSSSSSTKVQHHQSCMCRSLYKLAPS